MINKENIDELIPLLHNRASVSYNKAMLCDANEYSSLVLTFNDKDNKEQGIVLPRTAKEEILIMLDVEIRELDKKILEVMADMMKGGEE